MVVDRSLLSASARIVGQTLVPHVFPSVACPYPSAPHAEPTEGRPRSPIGLPHYRPVPKCLSAECLSETCGYGHMALGQGKPDEGGWTSLTGGPTLETQTSISEADTPIASSPRETTGDISEHRNGLRGASEKTERRVVYREERHQLFRENGCGNGAYLPLFLFMGYMTHRR